MVFISFCVARRFFLEISQMVMALMPCFAKAKAVAFPIPRTVYYQFQSAMLRERRCSYQMLHL